MAERKRIGVPISGLDTSTPDHSVVDGKCETLHNLRHTGEAWRNVKEFEGITIAEADAPLEYKHPASPKNNYIRVREIEETATHIDYYAISNGANTYYTKKPLSEIQGGDVEDILYTKTYTIIQKLGYIHSHSADSLVYEPALLGPYIFFSKATLISQTAPIRTTLYFLREIPLIGDSVYERNADGAYIALGVIDNIVDNVYDITIGETSYTTTIKSLSPRTLHLSQKYNSPMLSLERDITIYLPSLRPQVGALMEVYIANANRSTNTIYTIDSVTIESRTDNDSDMQDNPAWWPKDYDYITIEATDINGQSETFHIDSRRATTNEYLVKLTNITEVPEQNVTSTTTENRYSVEEVDVITNTTLQVIATYPQRPSSIGHFGRLLIVRDDVGKSNHFYMYSNGAYSRYISNSDGVRCNISVKDSIHSPLLTIVPIPTDAKDNDDDGYVRKYNAILALSERITYTQTPNENSLINTTEDGFFRGEFAIFVSMRNAEGVEIARTIPQIVRNETISKSLGKSFVYDAEEFFENQYLVYSTLSLPFEVSRSLAQVTSDKYTYSGLWDALMRLDPSNSGVFYYKELVDEYLSAMRELITSDKLYKLQLDIDLDADISGVESIEIYATRLYPLYVFEEEKLKINPVKILREPFYRMASLERSKRTFEITASAFKNIEQSPVYEASQSVGSLYSPRGFEYNNSYHMVGVEVLAPRLNNDSFAFEEDGVAADCLIDSVYDDKTYSSFVKADNDKLFALEQPSIITIPARSNRVAFGVKGVANFSANSIFDPEYVTAMGFSYIANILSDLDSRSILEGSDSLHKQSQSNVRSQIESAYSSLAKYAPIQLLNVEQKEIRIGESFPVLQPNRIQASSTNNPLEYPYENSYRIGTATNEIIAINSGAIEMSDAKFGEFPVYVFTKEGIFAMQSGRETLYSSIVPINYDVVINPNTLAVNGAVLYFTDKGLHALTNQGAQLLSAPLHTSENRIPEWMRTTQMVYLPEWNEVLCTDLPNRKAYVFSLDSKVWSTRDIPEGYILNNDELVGGDFIYNLRNEKEQGKDSISVGISTRPIKLGSMELKRAETIIVRFECATEQTLLIDIEGSVDTQHWQTLRELKNVKTNKDIIIRRTPCSVKYLRFTIEGNVTDDIRILAFEVEYYNRMRHRMR
ncbi:MAG: hypothetical protein IKA04_11095 [Alistipes sp.]|nr:hypothetical protein [Alistipes sp.]